MSVIINLHSQLISTPVLGYIANYYVQNYTVKEQTTCIQYIAIAV